MIHHMNHVHHTSMIHHLHNLFPPMTSPPRLLNHHQNLHSQNQTHQLLESTTQMIHLPLITSHHRIPHTPRTHILKYIEAPTTPSPIHPCHHLPIHPKIPAHFHPQILPIHHYLPPIMEHLQHQPHTLMYSQK